jgi:hypothetical protein
MAGFTTVTASLVAGTVGQLAETLGRARSYVLLDAVALPPGRAVVYDAANDSVKLPSGAAQKFMGVCFDGGNLPLDTVAFTAAGVNDLDILEDGVCWVLTSEAVDPSDAVYFQHDGTGSGAAGTFRTDNDGGKATLIAYGCQWAGVYSSGKAALRVNLPA